jgi:hypothetical protein
VGVFLGGLFGFSCGLWGVCWVGVLSGLVWVFDGGYSVFGALGFMGAPCRFRVLGLILVGLFGFFLFVGWLCWFLYILPVYLGATYAF